MGAPEYSPQRIKFIAKLLADNTPQQAQPGA
jgi:hypothetical protein